MRLISNQTSNRKQTTMTNEQKMYQLIRKHETLTRIFNRAMAARDFEIAQVFSASLDELDDQIEASRQTLHA